MKPFRKLVHMTAEIDVQPAPTEWLSGRIYPDGRVGWLHGLKVIRHSDDLAGLPSAVDVYMTTANHSPGKVPSVWDQVAEIIGEIAAGTLPGDGVSTTSDATLNLGEDRRPFCGLQAHLALTVLTGGKRAHYSVFCWGEVERGADVT